MTDHLESATRQYLVQELLRCRKALDIISECTFAGTSEAAFIALRNIGGIAERALRGEAP